MRNLIFIAVIVALGGLLSGYDTGVISGALLYIRDDWPLSEKAAGLLVSCVLMGAAIGAFTNGVLADIFGRKKIIVATAFVFLIGSIACAVAPNIHFLMASRFFIGIAIGVVTFVVPLYLSEISPEKHRGSLVSLFQLAITAGILFSYLINAGFANVPHDWRWMLGVGVVPAFILLIGMLKMSDTPRWYVMRGRYNAAIAAFEKIQPEIDAAAEVEKIKEVLADEGIKTKNCAKGAKSAKSGFKFKKWMLVPLFIGIGAMFVQQWTGINTIIYYAPTILKFAGFESNSSAIYATITIGVVNFLMTFVAIAFCDKFGRKPLLYAGLIGMACSLLVLGCAFQFGTTLGESLKWLALGATVTYIMCFSFSLGPIMLLMISEILPLSVRGVGMSIAIMSNFFFNFTVAVSFLPMLEHFGKANSFWLYAGLCVISFIFCYFALPETRGLTLEKIEQNWINKVKPRDF